jgi:predicted phage terminase large subunit-like protein
MKVKAIQRNIDKVQRVNMFAGYIELGNVWLSSEVSGISFLMDEAVGFPNYPHDDTIDPMLDAIENLIVKKRNAFF